jgi:hypothetical protein
LSPSCWCDFLGALYVGNGKSIGEGGIGNTKGSKIFINDVLGTVNPAYKAVSKDLIKVYRHGTVHQYAPSGPFDIRHPSDRAHLDITAQTAHAELLAADPTIGEMNLNSPDQVADLLFNRWGLTPIKQTPAGSDSTDKETLYELEFDHPLADEEYVIRPVYVPNTRACG